MTYDAWTARTYGLESTGSHGTLDDNKYEVQKAEALNSIREANRPKLTKEEHKAIEDEMTSLWTGLDELQPAEQLSRYERIMELTRKRGWCRSYDPMFDIHTVRRINKSIDKLQAQLKA